jgi:hypothetical protein
VFVARKTRLEGQPEISQVEVANRGVIDVQDDFSFLNSKSALSK